MFCIMMTVKVYYMKDAHNNGEKNFYTDQKSFKIVFLKRQKFNFYILKKHQKYGEKCEKLNDRKFNFDIYN